MARARAPRRGLRRPRASREQSGGNSRFLAPRENLSEGTPELAQRPGNITLFNRPAGLAGSVRPPNGVVLRGIEPRRSPFDLPGVHVIGELDHPVHRYIGGGHILAPEAISPARRVGPAGLDSGDRKFRLRGCGHQGRRRRRLRNGPGGLVSGASQIQRECGTRPASTSRGWCCRLR